MDTPRWHIKGVYLRMDGTIAPLPFRTSHEGMWSFDGQVFYLPKRAAYLKDNAGIA